LSKKCQFFGKNFRRKYFKNRNIGPWFNEYESFVTFYKTGPALLGRSDVETIAEERNPTRIFFGSIRT
jgi:hypothetical protein